MIYPYPKSDVPPSKAIGNTLDQGTVSSSLRVSQYFSYMISSNPSEIAGIPGDQMTKGREKQRIDPQDYNYWKYNT